MVVSILVFAVFLSSTLTSAQGASPTDGASSCTAAAGCTVDVPDGISALQVKGKDRPTPSHTAGVQFTPKDIAEATEAALTRLKDEADEITEPYPPLVMKPATARDFTCEGPWCAMLVEFNKLFDTADPATVQGAVDTYSEWEGERDGIMIGLTRDHYYNLDHEKVQEKMDLILSRQVFSWSFEPSLKVVNVDDSEPDVITVARDGTFTQRLTWWQRSIVWNVYMRRLPRGQYFPYSTVTRFRNCEACPAKALFSLKKGGLTGATDDWKIVGVTLLKLG